MSDNLISANARYYINYMIKCKKCESTDLYLVHDYRTVAQLNIFTKYNSKEGQFESNIVQKDLMEARADIKNGGIGQYYYCLVAARDKVIGSDPRWYLGHHIYESQKIIRKQFKIRSIKSYIECDDCNHRESVPECDSIFKEILLRDQGLTE